MAILYVFLVLLQRVKTSNINGQEYLRGENRNPHVTEYMFIFYRTQLTVFFKKIMWPTVYTFKVFLIVTEKSTKLNNAGKCRLPNAIPQTLVCFSWYHLQMKAPVERPH